MKKKAVSDKRNTVSQRIPDTEPDIAPDHNSILVNGEHESRKIQKLSLMAGINLIDGKVIGQVKESKDPKEFIDFLRRIDLHHEPQTAIHMILDNDSSHRSKIVLDYLATRPGRFKFTFSPEHTTWLNLIENLFRKLMRFKMRGQHFENQQQLDEYIEDLLHKMNQVPVVPLWDGKVEEIKQAFNA